MTSPIIVNVNGAKVAISHHSPITALRMMRLFKLIPDAAKAIAEELGFGEAEAVVLQNALYDYAAICVRCHVTDGELPFPLLPHTAGVNEFQAGAVLFIDAPDITVIDTLQTTINHIDEPGDKALVPEKPTDPNS